MPKPNMFFTSLQMTFHLTATMMHHQHLLIDVMAKNLFPKDNHIKIWIMTSTGDKENILHLLANGGFYLYVYNAGICI